VNSHPSGVVRRHEMRDSRPFSSALWQGEQDFFTSSLVMGIPDSSSSFSFSVGSFGGGCGGWATSIGTNSATEMAHPASTLMVKTIIKQKRVSPWCRCSYHYVAAA
jgi:hypothetical protein